MKKYIALLTLAVALAEQFQSSIAAQSLAVGELWYRPTTDTAHAICFALTERGPLFIEPQTRQLVTLTPDQWASRFFVRM